MSQQNSADPNINPCNMCMPMEAAGVFKGIENCMVLMHGSQGCTTYIRKQMAMHYNEPVDIASSLLNEKGTVTGSGAHLKRALGNVIRQYKPRVIGILTSCLSGNTGENVEDIVREYLAEENIKGIDCITISGDGDSRFAGHYRTARCIIEHFAQESGRIKSINVIAGSMSPGDIRHIKELLCRFGVKYTLFPDISETLDGEYYAKYSRIPVGGTRVAEIRDMGKAVMTFEFGQTVDEEDSPGEFLKKKFGIPVCRLPLPIGLKNTDLFINKLSEITGRIVPDKTRCERGRYLDAMTDSHKYNVKGKVGVFGNPELVYAVTALCLEDGMSLSLAACGPLNEKLGRELKLLAQEYKKEFEILTGAGYEKIAEAVRDSNTNLLIGPSEGSFITEKYGIPLVRAGFPVLDRMGAQRKNFMGYVGSMNLMDEMTNTLLDTRKSAYRNRKYKNK